MSVSDLEKSVLKYLTEKGGTGNIMEQLPTSFDFDQAFEFANNLQNKDFVKLLYSNFNKKLIVVELTLLGFREGK
ncbi:MAG: hypothetical protein JNM78_07945 [Cyclobacteriaceae bacterium]|nr:hypothetical protein [Cyclobacteriaceae bacterium]